MKKLIGSVIVAVALWSGTTAFIGNSMKENIQQRIDKTNNLYTEYGIQYKVHNYEKDFFQSKVQIEVDITDPLLAEVLKPSLKLPILLDYTIKHGPLFLENGLSFGAAQLHKELLVSSLLTDSAKKEFLTLVKDDIKITNDMTVSFTKNASYKLISDAVNIDNDGKVFIMSPLNIQGNSNITTFRGKNQLNLSSLSFKEKESNNGLEVENLVMNLNIDEFIQQVFMLGSIEIKADKFMLRDKSNPIFPEMDIALDLKMRNEKETQKSINSIVEGNIDFKDTKLPESFPKLQHLHTKIDIKSLGLKGMISFQDAVKEMQETQKKLFTNMGQGTSSKEFEKKFLEFQKKQEEMVEKIIHALNSLLIKDKSAIAYTIDMQTKDKKESQLFTEVNYVGDLEFKGSIESLALKIQQQIFDIINLDMKMKLNKEHLKSFPNAEVLNQQIQMAVVQGFVKEVNGSYLLDGYYKNRELIINDQNLTSTILPLLMMAGQMAQP